MTNIPPFPSFGTAARQTIIPAPTKTSTFLMMVATFSNSSKASSAERPEDDNQASPEIHEYRLASLCTIIIIPFVVGIGLFGNIMTAAIYFAPRLRHASVNVLLGGLAVSDATVLFFGGTVMFPLGLHQYAGHLPWFIRYVGWATVFGYPLAVTAQMCSIYILILITVERYMAVCYPLEARRACTVRAAWIGLGGCATFALAFNFSRFYEFGRSDGDGSPVQLLKESFTYAVAYSMWLDLIFNCVIPFTLLCVFNTHIIRSVNRASQFQKKSMAEQQRKLKPKKFQTTWMMVVVILIFLFSNSLSFALSILEVTSKEDLNKYLAWFLIDLSNLLVQLNSALNFIVYLIFSASYRRQWRRKLFTANALLPFREPFTDIFRRMKNQSTELEVLDSRMRPVSSDNHTTTVIGSVVSCCTLHAATATHSSSSTTAAAAAAFVTSGGRSTSVPSVKTLLKDSATGQSSHQQLIVTVAHISTAATATTSTTKLATLATINHNNSNADGYPAAGAYNDNPRFRRNPRRFVQLMNSKVLVESKTNVVCEATNNRRENGKTNNRRDPSDEDKTQKKTMKKKNLHRKVQKTSVSCDPEHLITNSTTEACDNRKRDDKDKEGNSDSEAKIK